MARPLMGMSELELILNCWRAGAPGAVLATVVHVKGSAYRRPGARMLILPDGQHIGSISGGCLEGDVCQKARWLTQHAPVHSRDTTGRAQWFTASAIRHD